MNSEFTRKDIIAWDKVMPEVEARAGKYYEKTYIRDIIKKRRTNKTLKPHLVAMGLMEE